MHGTSPSTGTRKPSPTLLLEASCGATPVAGVDEVGRGPLAGPVLAAAVILDPANVPEGLRDSKAMSPRARERAYAEVMLKALAVGVATATAAEIDATDIRRATHLAMRRAVAALAIRPALALVDGVDDPVLDDCPAIPVIGGDGLSQSIAAASIVAKVTRDRSMTLLDACFPGYGFARHAGYGTREHMEAIRSRGPTPVHRMTFGPLHGPRTAR